MWETIGELVLVWWNTSLSPPVSAKSGQASADDKAFAADELRAMYQERAFQLLGLCEVVEEDVKFIVAALNNPHLDYHVQEKAGRALPDVAIVYDRRYLQLKQSQPWVSSLNRIQTIKIAETISFHVPAAEQDIFVIASHWPSLRTAPEDESHRVEIALGCRQFISALPKINERDPFIVMMGDYNAEPFSAPLARHLFATRDRSLVLNFPGYLYNPYWRLLGEATPYAADGNVRHVSGTCYNPSDNYRTWAAFDQIIFSRPFLEDGAMVLDESKTKIIASKTLETEIRKSKSVFDHFPVTSSIAIRKKNE